MTTPITQAIDKLHSDQEQRHDWLIRAGEQARRMNAAARFDNWTVEVIDLGGERWGVRG